MPIISVFFGIIIRMFYREHEPAHFHAEHQGQQAKIQSKTARRLVREWASAHRRELEKNWKSMKAGRPLDWIEPLS